MPEPIKSLQLVPIFMSYAFSKEMDRTKLAKFGKNLAKEHPGYDAKNVEDDEAADRAADSELMVPGERSVVVCKQIDDRVLLGETRSRPTGRSHSHSPDTRWTSHSLCFLHYVLSFSSS
jgi:hypothetical protein